MGKLSLFVFMTAAVLLIYYLVAFIISIILALSQVLNISIMAPIKDYMLWIQSYASTLFLTGLPLIIGLGLALLTLLSRRGPSVPTVIKYEPIKEPRINVVLTAYNDEEPIYDAVMDFKNQRYVVKVIVVDNNSVDDTSKRAAEAGAEVVREEKQGYGYACIRGLREAFSKDCNIIALSEGDRTFRGYDLRKLVPYLDNADMVLGTRTTQELLDQRSQLDWFLVWGNLFLAKLIQIKYWDAKCWGKVRLTDVGCTFRVLRREALEKIIDQLTIGREHFSPHMIMVALNNNLKVVEVPVTFRERVGLSKGAGGSRLKAVKIGLSMLWHILTY